MELITENGNLAVEVVFGTKLKGEEPEVGNGKLYNKQGKCSTGPT